MTQTLRAEQSKFTKYLDTFVAEASSLELGPGDFPHTIILALDARGMEPAMDVEHEFLRFESTGGGDIVSAVYISPLGSSFVELLND